MANNGIERRICIEMRVRADVIDGEVETYDAVRIPYGIKLSVGQVSCGLADSVGTGMCSNERGVTQ